jgi:hypothetical protein
MTMRRSLSWRAPSSLSTNPTQTASRWHLTGAATALSEVPPAQGSACRVNPNQLYAMPYFVSNSERVEQVALHVTAAGSYVDVGLYQVTCGATFLPGTALVTTQMSVGATGVRTAPVAVILRDQSVWWWVALAVSSVALSGGNWNRFPAIFGYDSTSLSLGYASVVASWAYASGLPSTFPGSVTYVGSGIPTLGVLVTRIA